MRSSATMKGRGKGVDSCVLLFELTCQTCSATANSLGTYTAHRTNNHCRGTPVRCGCCNVVFNTLRDITYHLQRPGIALVPPYSNSTVACMAPPATAVSSTDESIQVSNLLTVDVDLYNIMMDPGFPPFYDPSDDILSQPTINLITTSTTTETPSTSAISYVSSDSVVVSPTRPSILPCPPVGSPYPTPVSSTQAATHTFIPLRTSPISSLDTPPSQTHTITASISVFAAAQPQQQPTTMPQDFRFDNFNDFALLAYLYGIVRSPIGRAYHASRLYTLENSFRRQLALDTTLFPHALTADLSELLYLFESVYFTHALVGRRH